MQGNLKQIQLPEVLQFISMGKSSGKLTVSTRDSVETTLMIKSGKIINSTALERQRRLGDLLVHRGILRRSVLSQVLSLQRTVESDKRLGQILIDREIVSANTIRDVLKLQLEEEIWNLFGLDDGEFRFEQVDEDKLGDANLQIDIEPLLLEGTRRQDEWRKLVRLLPSDKMIPIANLPKDRDKKFKPTPAEWKVLAQLNGRFNIRAIVNRAGMGRFEVYQILAEFIRRGLVAIRKNDATQHQAEEVPPVPATPMQSVAAASGGVVGSIFSRLTGGSRRDEKAEKLQFVSAVGALTWLINRFVENAYGLREFKPQPGDSRLVELLWTELISGYTKADMITIEKNRVMSDQLERTLRLFEFSEATADTYEDSLEGLVQLLDGIFRQIAARVGDKVTVKCLRDTLEEMVGRLVFEHPPGDFKIDERVQNIIRTAA